jgi:hypothetical protein
MRGHVGQFSGPVGPWERLEVGRCCGRGDTVVLIADGGVNFLDLLNEWRKQLRAQLLKEQGR